MENSFKTKQVSILFKIIKSTSDVMPIRTPKAIKTGCKNAPIKPPIKPDTANTTKNTNDTDNNIGLLSDVRLFESADFFHFEMANAVIEVITANARNITEAIFISTLIPLAPPFLFAYFL